MSLLTIKERQQIMKEHSPSLYRGKIDGIEGSLTKAGYRAMQTAHFTRKADIDGVYGEKTDILFRNIRAVAKNCTNFTVNEFRCNCGGKYCNGFPVRLDTKMLKMAQKIRTAVGQPVFIHSALRCKNQNIAVGGIALSRHMTGKAFDWSCARTRASVNERMKMIQKINKWEESFYTYMNGYAWLNQKFYGTPNVPSMGNAIHADVK